MKLSFVGTSLSSLGILQRLSLIWCSGLTEADVQELCDALRSKDSFQNFFLAVGYRAGEQHRVSQEFLDRLKETDPTRFDLRVVEREETYSESYLLEDPDDLDSESDIRGCTDDLGTDSGAQEGSDIDVE